MKRPDYLHNKSGRAHSIKSDDARNFHTDNPRHLRALQSLLRRPMPREHLDREVGCSNSPELVAELRRRGLDVPCTRVRDLDRDGMEIRRGVYHLTHRDRRIVRRFFRRRTW